VVGVVGLGLIGGSVALDLLADGRTVLGWDTDAAQGDDARAAGVEVVAGPGALAAACDLVVVAVPAPRVADVLAELDAAASRPLVTTDVASVQSPDVLGLDGVVRRCVQHVGGHPMTGTERSGFRAARRGMFDGSPWLLTPSAGDDVTAVRAVLDLVLGLRAAAVVVDAGEHDRVVAHISHLPHVLAYTAYREVRDHFPPSVESLAGGSFRGLTRVAATRPDFWAEVLDLNRHAVADAVAGLRDRLAELEALLRDGAGPDALGEVLATGHRAVGRPRPVVPPPTALPGSGPLGQGVLAELHANGRAGLAVAGVDDGHVTWTVL
jgi:prephenate dehydrogenase